MKISAAVIATSLLSGSCWDRGKEAVLPEPELSFVESGSNAFTVANVLASVNEWPMRPSDLTVTDFEGRGVVVLGTFDSAGRFTLNREVCK